MTTPREAEVPSAMTLVQVALRLPLLLSETALLAVTAHIARKWGSVDSHQIFSTALAGVSLRRSKRGDTREKGPKAF